ARVSPERAGAVPGPRSLHRALPPRIGGQGSGLGVVVALAEVEGVPGHPERGRMRLGLARPPAPAFTGRLRPPRTEVGPLAAPSRLGSLHSAGWWRARRLRLGQLVYRCDRGPGRC